MKKLLQSKKFRVASGILAGLVVVCFFGFSLLFFNPLEGRYSGDLLDLVPADVSWALRLENGESLWKAFEADPVRRELVASPRYRGLVDSREFSEFKVRSGIEQMLKRLEEMGFLERTNLFGALGKDVLVAMRLDDDPTKRGEALVLARVSFRIKLGEAVFERFGSSMLPAGASLQRSGDFMQLRTPAGPSLYLGRIRDILVLSSSADLIAGSFALRAGKGASLAAALPPGSTSSERVGSFYFSPLRMERLRQIELKAEHNQLPGFLNPFGFLYREILNAPASPLVVGRLRFPGRDFTRLVFEADITHDPARLGTGWRGHHDLDPARSHLVKVLPPSVFFFRVFRGDVKEMFARFHANLSHSHTFGMWKDNLTSFMQMCDRQERAAGSFERDFLSLLGPDMILMLGRVDYDRLGVRTRNRFPAVSVALRVRNALGVKRFLEQTLHRFPHTLAVRPVQPVMVRGRKVPGAFRMQIDNNPYPEAIDPGYYLTPHFLVFTSHISCIDEFRHTAGGRLQSTPVFRRAHRLFGDEETPEAGLHLYLDFHQLLEVAAECRDYWVTTLVTSRTDQRRIRSRLERENAPRRRRMTPQQFTEFLDRAGQEEMKRLIAGEKSVWRQRLDRMRLLDYLIVTVRYGKEKSGLQGELGMSPR